MSFPDVAEAAFGPMGRYVAGMLAYVDMFALIIGSMLLTAHSSMVLISAICIVKIFETKQKRRGRR